MRIRGLAMVAGLAASAGAWGADLSSNGHGGGPWSAAATWHDNAVPTAADSVTVLGEDHVVVDLKDDAKIACRELSVDPRGVLSFQQGAGKIVLIVSGPVESYGLLRFDMKDTADGSGELRLVSTNVEQRIVQLQRGGALVLYGRAGLPDGEKNVWLSSRPPTGDPSARLEATERTSLDINNAALTNMQVFCTGIDNTGATPNERLNIVGSRFTGRTLIHLGTCDTGLVANNEVVSAPQPAGDSGIRFDGCTLGEVRGNRVTGPYQYGICLAGQTDGAILGNTVTGALVGFYYGGPNGMLQHNLARNCVGEGLMFRGSGVASDLTVENCPVGVSGSGAGVFQLDSLHLTKSPSNAVALAATDGVRFILLNCPVAAAAVKTGGTPRLENGQPSWWVTAKQYVVVHVTGTVPAATQVAIVTAHPDKPLPAGALDPNVNNSPVTIGPGGWTPLPQALNPLVVRSWRIEANGKITPAPAYKVRVLGPAPKPGAPQPVLKEVELTPLESWYRPEPNALTATVEVQVP